MQRTLHEIKEVIAESDTDPDDEYREQIEGHLTQFQTACKQGDAKTAMKFYNEAWGEVAGLDGVGIAHDGGWRHAWYQERFLE